MRRILIISLAVMLFLLAACVADESPLELGESSLESAEESEYNESEGLHISSESNEASQPFLDIVLDLLPLFGNFEDPDEQDKVNNFFNFILEYYDYESEPLLSIYSHIKEHGYSDDIWDKYTGNSLHVWRSLYLDEPNTESNVRFISAGNAKANKETIITFGGDVCFGDDYVTMPYLQNRKNGILNKCISQKWIDFMNEADIATLNNEFSISSRGTPMQGKTYTYRAKPEYTRYYNEMGIDFVTLANNHVFDYGKDAFFDTMSTLDEYGIDYAGAGKNAEDAQKPIYYIVNGKKIGFISATRAEKHILTPEATESEPGVFRCYDPERLLQVIEETKNRCDFVILFIHWGAENSEKLERVQKTTSHEYIDAGADLIIGTHAHCLQGIEFYKGKAIFYNLGNFWFSAKEIETGQAKLVLAPDLTTEYYFIPGLQAACKVSYELGTARGREILDHLSAYDPSQVIIEDDGHIIYNATENEQ